MNWNPSDRGYTFTNPDTPEGLLARKVENGYVFAGWCRETSFCCPAGYEVANLTDGRKECVACADSNSANCDGSLYTPTNEKPNIDTKAAENRKGSITYYAMLVSEKRCDPGEYLNTGNLECEACPVGHYCPGGSVSTNNTGKYECPVGTYRQIIGATQMEYDAVTGDGCKPCEIGVEEYWREKLSDPTFDIPDNLPNSEPKNGLTTKTSARCLSVDIIVVQIITMQMITDINVTNLVKLALIALVVGLLRMDGLHNFTAIPILAKGC